MGIWKGNKGKNKTNKRNDQIERKKISGRPNRREVKTQKKSNGTAGKLYRVGGGKGRRKIKEKNEEELGRGRWRERKKN